MSEKFVEGIPLPQRTAIVTYAIAMVCATALVVAKVPWAQGLFLTILGWGVKSPLFPMMPALSIPMGPGTPQAIVTVMPPPLPPPIAASSPTPPPPIEEIPPVISGLPPEGGAR